MAQFQFTRLTDHGAQRTSCLAEAMGTENLSQQTWLFVSPHDDDLCIGAGLFMQAAIREGATVQVLIVTDGCMGYCHLEDRDRIVDIRREETFKSFESWEFRRTMSTMSAIPMAVWFPSSVAARLNPARMPSPATSASRTPLRTICGKSARRGSTFRRTPTCIRTIGLRTAN